MAPGKAFYTRTMANVYVSQGKYEEAADILRYLLSEDPENTELRRALSGLEMKCPPESEGGLEPLTGLFRSWLQLASHYHQVKRLRKIKRRIP